MLPARTTLLGLLLTAAIAVSICLGNITAEKALGEHGNSVEGVSSLRARLASFHPSPGDEEPDGDDVDPDEFWDEGECCHHDEDDELDIEFAELELFRNQLRKSLRLATDEVRAAVYAIQMLEDLAEPDQIIPLFQELLRSTKNPKVERSLRIGLMHAHAARGDVHSAMEVARQLISSSRGQ